MSEVVLVAALGHDRVIGDGHGMPWRLPEDMAHFRRVTMGHPVVMGRRTWDTLSPKFKPLPGRRNIVVTRNAAWQAEGAERAASLDEALALAGDVPTVCVIGGGELYALALPRADVLELTEIDAAFKGHVQFPSYRQAFREAGREGHRAAPPNDFEFAFVTYRRRDADD